jgi:hypothetical protein
MIAALILGVLGFQDPFVVAPDDYKLELENAYVRLVRVTYGPNQKSPVHDHPATPTVYVYTTDGDRMRIVHEGDKDVIRPAVKAGQIRFNHGMLEHHTMENLGDTRSEYIRVELKTKPVDLPVKDVRLSPTDPQFENGMIRISREADGKPEKYPSVYVVLGSGNTSFVPAGGIYSLGAGDSVVKVELKTAPK